MQTIIFLGMAVLHGIALFLIAKLFLKNKKSYTLLATFAIAGLFYDNLIVGIGRFIGEGSLLETLNAGRFYSHAIVTPLLIIFAYGVIRQTVAKGQYDRILHSLFCLLAVAMIAMSVMSEIINLSLVFLVENGVERYVNAASEGPPIPSIITIIVMIIAGIYIWRKVGWAWLALGSIVMFVMAGAGVNNTLLTNIGEVVFVTVIVMTDYAIQQESLPLFSPKLKLAKA